MIQVPVPGMFSVPLPRVQIYLWYFTGAGEDDHHWCRSYRSGTWLRLEQAWLTGQFACTPLYGTRTNIGRYLPVLSTVPRYCIYFSSLYGQFLF